jgi:guanylate kinase
MRDTEQQGREHHFVSESEFERMKADGELLEWQVVHEHLYGTPRATVEDAIADGQDLIADIEVLGATYLRSAYPDNVVLVFVRPKTLDVLVERMRSRGETQAAIDLRMRRVPMEMEYALQCDYLIINDLIGPASDVLYAIVLAERSKRELRRLKAQSPEKQTLG